MTVLSIKVVINKLGPEDEFAFYRYIVGSLSS